MQRHLSTAAQLASLPDQAAASASTKTLLRMRGVGRKFAAGDQIVTVLQDIDLDIHAGEMVAIVGASGSGKSTLVNILGCLDRPTCGSYAISGRHTSTMTPNELAALRREHFGYVFQRYHLLDLTAVANVEVPAIYAGVPREARRERARILLERLGLADRMNHKPSQLSGGQQQRVSVARAVMIGGHVILADEPTGALDSKSGEEVMKILAELHAEGHTIIIVTHDMSVAQHAERIIEIRDGAIVADHPNERGPVRGARDLTKPGGKLGQGSASSLAAVRDRLVEAFHMAVLAMQAHRMRTILTMLGIIVGIASVVSVVALGNGTEQRIMTRISSLGTNTIDIYPGQGFGDMDSGKVQTLQVADAAALAGQSYVDSATPSVSITLTARYGSAVATAQVSGVGNQYFRVRGVEPVEGSFFNFAAVKRIQQSVVIDENSRAQLFGAENPIGKIVLLGRVPCRVVGVAGRSAMMQSTSLSMWVPYTTALARMLGQRHVSSITVRVADDIPMAAAEEAITKLLKLRHGRKDFYLYNKQEIRQTVQATTRTTTVLIGSIAAIALVVGGIGVMNIMLVSVTERTREIGVRVAVGARQSDILQQFLIEAILICLVGGLFGVLLALALGVVFKLFVTEFTMIFSLGSIVGAFIFSTLIGVVFGFLPARNAARLDPVLALARE